MADLIETARILLHRDGLGEAEQITGNSYKEDEVTMALGFINHLGLVEARKNALAAIGDTHNGQTFEEHCAVFFDLGFKIVYIDEFRAVEYGYDEVFYILWLAEKGILGVVESYRGNRVNHSNIYYNVRMKNRDNYNWRYTSSHGPILEDLILQGNHDTREGLKVAVDGLEKLGEFMPVWTYNPIFSLVNYVEWKIPNVDYKAITKKRIADIPEEVRSAITKE